MNKKVQLLLAGAMSLAAMGIVGWIFANANTPPAAKSAAPGENSCAQCHSGNVNTGAGNATLTLGNNETTYTPGNAYVITVNVTDPNFTRYGFQTTALANGAGPTVGTFALSNTLNTSTQTATVAGNQRRYVSHKAANSNGSWVFNWTAPPTNVGTITFYLVGNATNNSNSSSGDRVYTRTFSFPATPPPPPTAAFSPNLTFVCPGGSVTFTDQSSSAPTAWSWSFPGGNPSTSTAANPTVSYPAAGTYSVTLVATNGTGSDTIEQVDLITVNPTPSLSGLVTNTSCNAGNDGSIDLSVTGTSGNTFVWSNGSTSEDPGGLAPGTYTVTVTSGDGCPAVGTYTVGQPTAVTASTTTTPSDCGAATGSATVSPNGGAPGYTYNWSDGSTTAIASNLAAGSYTVTVTDANGCTGTGLAVVSNTGAPGVNISSAMVACNGGSDGSATALVAGGTQPYTFLWSNGDTSATTSGLAAGTYTVTVTDAGQCINVQAVTITEPTAMTLSTTSTVDLGNNEGSATVTPAGGTAPYTYLWSNGGTTPTIDNLPAGTYDVTVTDANGCTATTSATVFFGVGIAADMGASLFTVGPNPFDEVLILRPSVPMLGKFVVHLMDIEGRIVLGQQLEADGMRPHRIGTNALPNGIYLLMVISENGKMLQKVVKNSR